LFSPSAAEGARQTAAVGCGWVGGKKGGCSGELITGSAPRVDLSGLTASPEPAVLPVPNEAPFVVMSFECDF